ncbi:predicted protein [Histoplasma mississippiense (nom. inval.)]|uniref:predicted protein n=1 Tax=Ajellomyces capsulatus (strain NAm1 / WU24) TaxID=2059318 RepID=UPI000157CE98|nr:predicted protein [Histoplasma mississippiense (nom. inval.)]EDN10713.1 predicted protein [Histoplasma mississippiense (nom. inval.)]
MQSSTPSSLRPKGLNWPVSSHITVFVRNLRLLHFDQLPDWPNITVRSFSGAQPNLRQRIKVVEWSLYQLFTIWDPEGAQNKLRPFFPPLEPLQSVNLRAALFRALSDMKKNGVLGREVILRKTMLDECKGEKFEEALATFSLTVLRKVILARKGEHHNPVLEMTINGRASSSEQEMLVPLIIAHRVSLTTMINDKCHIRQAYDQLKTLLENKTIELAARSKQAANKPTADEDELSHEIINLWHGNEKWAHTILNGGIRVSTDHVLESSFPQTLSLIRNGQLGDIGNRPSTDLLADLDNRLSEQKARVEKWRKFKHTLVEERGVKQPSKHRSSSQILAFRDHQSLTIASLAQSDRASTSLSTNGTEYSSPINMDTESLQPIPVQPTRAVLGNLVERTRQSMSFLPKPSSRSRQSLAAKPRKSQVFPTNQFETPKRDGPRSLESGGSGMSTPKEELFSQDADYASVFKSRPRIAMSPVNSPAVHMLPMDDSDMDADQTINIEK